MKRIYSLLTLIIFNGIQAVPIIPCEILFGSPERSMPVLSPEGDRFAYLAPHDAHNKALNLWVRSVDKADDRVITHVVGRGIAAHFWTYDGNSLIYFHDKDGRENYQLYRVDTETGNSTCLTPLENIRVGLIEYVKKYPETLLISMNKENPAYFDAYELDINTGTCTMTFKNPGYALGLIADKNLVIRCITRMDNEGGTDILIRANADDTWRPIIHWNAEECANSHVIGFNNEDNKLYILDSHDSNNNKFAVFDLVQNTQETLFQNKNSLYDITGIWFTPDMSRPIAAITLEEKKKIMVLARDFYDDFIKLSKLTSGEIARISYNNDNTRWIAGFINDQTSACYYYYDRTSKQASYLFSCQPALDQYQLAPMTPVTFTASDGLVLHGYLTRINQSKEQPLVLLVHGGPWLRDTWGYDPEAQFLANRGYACLQVNYRGSSGYGKNFLNAGNKEWGRRIHQDLIDSINWAVQSGIADPKSIAIMGASYGGYAALCGAAFNSNFLRCAVSLFGFSNIITLSKNKPAYWRPLDNIWKQRVGDLASEEEMLKERSPLFSAHRIACPLMIVQGKNDIRCPPEESAQMRAELEKNNIPHVYLEFDNEGHGIANQEKRTALYTSIEQFLAHYLTAPTPAL